MRRICLFLSIVWRRWEPRDLFWPQCIVGTLFRYEMHYRLTVADAWRISRLA